MLHKLETFLNEQALQARGVVIAISGGPDSVALLRALLHVWPEQRHVIAHLNHQLRGPASDADESFVRALHESLRQLHPQLHWCCERVAIAECAEAERANLEATARQYRYRWLTQVAREHNLSLIATGHTQNDQAETVLHRLLRGSGIQGLRGVAPRRRMADGIELIRPLLTVSRFDIENYLESLQQPSRVDESNLDRRLTRNRLRHELLPLLAREYNPQIARILTQLATQAEEVHREMQSLGDELLQRAEGPRQGAWIQLRPQSLGAVSAYQVRLLLRTLWEREAWPCGAMGYQQWCRLEQVWLGLRKSVDCPGGIRARQKGMVVLVGRAGQSDAS